MPARARRNRTSPRSLSPHSERLREKNCDYQRTYRRKVREQRKQQAEEIRLLRAEGRNMDHHTSSGSMSDFAPSLTAVSEPDTGALYNPTPQPGEPLRLARA